MQTLKQKISKTVNGKREEVGEIALVVPTLEDCAEFVAGAKIKEKDDEGLPVYEKDEANWIFSAILSYAKAAARNKLVPGTVSLKPGLAIATSWAEFCAEGERNTGAALALAREARTMFTEWLSKQGKAENVVAVISQLFANRTALQVQSADKKEKMSAYVQAWAESLEAETLERMARPIELVLEACAAESVDF